MADDADGTDAPVPLAGGLVRALSRVATVIRGNENARANEEANASAAPAEALERAPTKRERNMDTTATKLDENAVRVDALSKTKSKRMQKILAKRVEEEAVASDEEEEDPAFTEHREAETVPEYTWTATMRRRLENNECDVAFDEDSEMAKAAEKSEGASTDNDEEEGANVPYRGGEPTQLTRMKSRINSMNAPTNSAGAPIRNPNADLSEKQDVVEDSYFLAVMSDKLPAYKRPRRHIARLENLESAVLDKDHKQLPVWSTTKSDMDVLGPGIGLWFAQLKRLGIVFFVLSCLASVFIAHYVHLAKTNTVDIDPEIKTTLGMTAVSTYASVYGVDIRTIMAFLSCLDVFIVLCFMAVGSGLARSIRAFVIRVDEALLTLSDYSLQVDGLPNNATEEEVREHFEEFGPVADVVIVRAFGRLLRMRMARARLFKKAEILKAELSAMRHNLRKKGESLEENRSFNRKWKEFYKIRDAIMDLKEKIDKTAQMPFDAFDVVTAFVTFEQETDKLACRDEYFAYFNCFRTERTMFRVEKTISENGQESMTYHYLKVKQAGEASDILWENMTNVSWKNYLIRRSTAALGIITLLVGAIVLVVLTTTWSKAGAQLVVSCNGLYTLNGNKNLYCPAIWDLDKDLSSADLRVISNENFRSQIDSSDCHKYVESAVWSYDMTQYSPYSAAIYSSSLTTEQARTAGYMDDKWNGGLDSTTTADECAAKVCYDCMCQSAALSGSVSDVCRDYYYDQVVIILFEVGRLTITALTSITLLWASAKFALFARFKTVSATERATSRYAFYTLLTNVLILPLLVNIDIEGLENFPILFRGSHQDVTLDWYALVMRSIMISAFINACYFGPWRLVGAWVQQFSRYTTSKWCKTQQKLNGLYARPKFTLAERYGQMMTVIFSTVVLFAAAPILIPVAALYCLLSYWSDKTLILRYCRFPALYSHTLAQQFLFYFPYACLAHFAFAAWVFSQWDVPSYFLESLDGWDESLQSQNEADFWSIRANMTRYAQLDFEERFYRVNGLIQLIPLLIYVAYHLIKSFLSGLGRTMLYVLGCARCLESDWSADVMFHNFTTVRDNMYKNDESVDGILSGLPSYRVHDNPEYVNLFPEARRFEQEQSFSKTAQEMPGEEHEEDSYVEKESSAVRNMWSTFAGKKE